MIKQWDGKDRHYLEAFGYGSDNKTTQIYNAVKSSSGLESNMTMIAWRLHPAIAVKDLKQTSLNQDTDKLERFRAIDGIAFCESQVAPKGNEKLSQNPAVKIKEKG